MGCWPERGKNARLVGKSFDRGVQGVMPCGTWRGWVAIMNPQAKVLFIYLARKMTLLLLFSKMYTK